MGYVAHRGRHALTGGPSSVAPSASTLLGPAPTDRSQAVEVYVSPDLLADLHAPDLVITPRYVGPERRRSPRRQSEAYAVPYRYRPLGGPAYGTRSLRWYQALAVVVATTAMVVPLTLLATRQASPALPAKAPTASLATATAARAARAQTHQAALARRRATQAAHRATQAAHRSAAAQQQAARTASQAGHLRARAADQQARTERQLARAADRQARAAARLVRVVDRPARSVHPAAPRR